MHDYQLSVFATTCHYLLPLTTACYHLPHLLSVAILPPPFATTCYCLSPPATLVTTCNLS
ncbi:unnamed protein product [Brugia pahangi]|uniref:Uncharacterized protein n=1 Tax=Brugia pahangi TaxID=6280 RepID=A0A0N4T7F5_BRUPA|nr:unnamed protein product [Brugia pahangi]